jgi:hypothetical protein
MVLTTLGIVLFLGYIIYSLMSLSQATCEVCITFHGGSECRSAQGANVEEARRTATDLACHFLSSSMADGIVCANTQPTKVTCTGN